MKTEYSDRAAEAAARAKANRNAKPDWKAIAFETLNALRLMNAFYDDLSKSNPGFMGKMCLQDYGAWNEALLQSERALTRYRHIVT